MLITDSGQLQYRNIMWTRNRKCNNIKAHSIGQFAIIQKISKDSGIKHSKQYHGHGMKKLDSSLPLFLPEVMTHFEHVRVLTRSPLYCPMWPTAELCVPAESSNHTWETNICFLECWLIVKKDASPWHAWPQAQLVQWDGAWRLQPYESWTLVILLTREQLCQVCRTWKF